jgi:predicted PurR-regulated permease PerM
VFIIFHPNIDLSPPFWSSLIVGIILLIIGGTYHYIVTLVSLNFTDKKLSNVLSELDTLSKKYEKEITNVNKWGKDEIKDITTQIDRIIEHNKPPIRMTLRQALSEYGNSKTK